MSWNLTKVINSLCKSIVVEHSSIVSHQQTPKRQRSTIGWSGLSPKAHDQRALLLIITPFADHHYWEAVYLPPFFLLLYFFPLHSFSFTCTCLNISLFLLAYILNHFSQVSAHLFDVWFSWHGHCGHCFHLWFQSFSLDCGCWRVNRPAVVFEDYKQWYRTGCLVNSCNTC